MKTLAASGVPENDAAKQMQSQTPAESEVPTYAKSGTVTLKRHLITKHEATLEEKGGSTPAINAIFPKAATVEDKVALVFCMNPNLPLSLVDDAFFQQAFGHPFGRWTPALVCVCAPFHSFRHTLPGVITDLAHRLEDKVADRVRGATVGLAIDGWTKWNHTKTINFLMIWKGTAVFWKSVESRYGKSANTLMHLTQIAIEELEKKCACSEIKLSLMMHKATSA
jgi:hypothetical protein